MQVQSTVLRTLGYAPGVGRRYTARQFFTWRLQTMARTLVALLAVLAASLIALPAEAQWKWRDKGGHVQYSDLPPPPGTPDGDILAPAERDDAPRRYRQRRTRRRCRRRQRCAAASAPRCAAGDPELEAKRKKAEAEAAAKNKAEQERIAASKLDNCSRARAQLTTLDSGIRLAQTNAKTASASSSTTSSAPTRRAASRTSITNDCK